MINDEKKYDELIKTLKGLQQVKAPPNFEADLKRRLNTEKYAKEEKKSTKRFFAPSRLIPSFGLAAAAVVAFLLINVNPEETDNPFMMEPKVREDMILFSETDDVEIPEGNLSKESEVIEEDVLGDTKDKEMKTESFTEEKSTDKNLIAGRNEAAITESTLTEETEVAPTNKVSAPMATGLAIRKSGLNFRQVNPTVKEQKEILELKKKVQNRTKMKKLE
jgi:hypothetical protein